MITKKAEKQGRKLYDYQQADIDTLFRYIEGDECIGQCRLLYQLPTGGGKTVIFSEIVSRYLSVSAKKALVLTHRKELCRQTSTVLTSAGVKSKMITSAVKRIRRNDEYRCYVAMVETLSNRLEDELLDPLAIGLVIVDEAHHNAFRKLFEYFPQAAIVGVTATPFSSDPEQPLNKDYSHLVTGPQVAELIASGFLAKPKTYDYEVELNTLRTGSSGDFSVSTSDELYSSSVMLDLLVSAYETHARHKKTLIFNNGIFTSKRVMETFSALGYPIRHLDNHTPAAEREETLKWLKKTKGAILTSVSILTTGFDEPSVQSIILNRATTSLTLYHQMIGRGSRALKNKKQFSIVDLGNNVERFGAWEEALDWNDVFLFPHKHHHQLKNAIQEIHRIPAELRSAFPNSLEVSFDILGHYQIAMQKGEKAVSVLKQAINQHVQMCLDHANTVQEAMELCTKLEKEIDWRVKEYCKCLGSVTKDYRKWLGEDYRSKLKKYLERGVVARRQIRVAV